MSSPASAPLTIDSGPSTPPADDEVLVRVEGVSKKFCRSLKKSLWYGVCDIAGELLPGRKRQEKAYLTTEHTEGTAGGNQQADSGEFLEGPSQAGLQMDSEKLASFRSANDPGGSEENVSSAKISEICGKQSDAPAGAGLRAGEFWAVKDVSFELRRGECLGLIGHNGAGKTTLLKMLNGLIKPDRGSITMRGRVGALIALGAGFNPILTGRENIYINGSVLGLTKKEIDAKIDEIIDFAEIREFIDMPVQNYSSGMSVRLGFSVASSMNPDVLILDEVLAVGDAKFRFKCYNRISKVIQSAAVILVTHNMEHVGQICTTALVMDHGLIIEAGSPIACISTYDGVNSNLSKAEDSFTRTEPPIRSIELQLPEKISYAKKIPVRFRLFSDDNLAGCFVRVAFYSETGAIVAEYNTKTNGLTFDFNAGENLVEFEIPIIFLKAKNYPVSFLVHDAKGLSNLVWSHKDFFITVVESPRGFADYIIS